jgi:hypothetical protein
LTLNNWQDRKQHSCAASLEDPVGQSLEALSNLTGVRLGLGGDSVNLFEVELVLLTALKHVNLNGVVTTK